AQPAVADRLLGPGGVAAQVDVDALGLELRAPLERRAERQDLALDRAGGARRLLLRGQLERLAGRGVEDRAREPGRRVDREAAVVERPAERPLEPRDELDALEAAEPDLALERGRGRDGAFRARAARLARELTHHVEHPDDDVVGDRRRRACREGHRGSLYPRVLAPERRRAP